MSDQAPLSIGEVQAINMKTLEHFIRFCDEHGLCYFLVGGALIGAVREGGLIAWDDDIDVAMKREDFDRFCTEYKDSEQYALFTHERNPDYCFGMAKLVDNRTTYIERVVDQRIELGTFIDIFPLDSIAGEQSLFIRSSLLLKKLYLYAFVLNEAATDGSVLKEVVRRLARATVGHMGQKRYFEWLQHRMAQAQTGDYLVNWWGAYGSRECCPSEWLGSTQLAGLGSLRCQVPVAYDAYLTHIYGDYMTPVAKPYHHGAVYWRSKAQGGPAGGGGGGA